jgi:cyclopropane fatty-acyl-phospholipid synthase-like methyltransferase
MKIFYDLWYRFGTPPWVGQARPELVELVTLGEMQPGRAIDLGCGEGDNAIFLAQHGFQVTGVDFSRAGIAKAKVKARGAGADVDFMIDDLTGLAGVKGQFDLLVDYGTFDDLSTKDRAAYVDQVTALAKAGAKFLLWCFEWELKGWERVATASCPSAISRCGQARWSSGSGTPSTSPGSRVRAICLDGHAAGRHTC